MQSSKLSSWRATVLCVALLVLCVVLSHPVAETGISDDFSYATSARVLADTGKLTYNGWSTAMLGWMLYWGALFVRLFGFSELVIRSAGLSLSAVTTVLMHRFMLRSGLTLRNATLGTLAVVLSPLYLALSYAFMSDIPGLLAMLAAVYCCLRAVQAADAQRTDGIVVGWLAAATILGVVLGSARQIAWLGVLVVVPSALWLLRRRRVVVAWGSVLWLAGCLAVRWLYHWFLAQPYSLSEHYFSEKITAADVARLVANVTRTVLELPLLILPVALGFVLYVSWSARRTRVAGAATLVAVLGFVGLELHRHNLRTWLQPTLLGALSDRGLWFIPISYDWQPIVLAFGWRLLASVAALVGMFAVAMCLLPPRRATAEMSLPAVEGAPAMATLLWLIGPLMASYFALLLSRAMYSGVGDRYLLVLMAGAITLLLRQSQRTERPRLQMLAQRVAVATIAVLATYGVVAMHDLFATYRARLVAIDQLRAQGVPRTAIRGQFEYDGTTEMSIAGYMMDIRMNPPGAFRPMPYDDWRMTAFPHVYPRYWVPIAYRRDACSSILPVIHVGNWMGTPLVIETLPFDPKGPIVPPDSCPATR